MLVTAPSEIAILMFSIDAVLAGFGSMPFSLEAGCLFGIVPGCPVVFFAFFIWLQPKC